MANSYRVDQSVPPAKIKAPDVSIFLLHYVPIMMGRRILIVTCKYLDDHPLPLPLVAQ